MILAPPAITYSVITVLASISLSGEASCHKFPISILVAVVEAMIKSSSTAVPTLRVALPPCRVVVQIANTRTKTAPLTLKMSKGSPAPL